MATQTVFQNGIKANGKLVFQVSFLWTILRKINHLTIENEEFADFFSFDFSSALCIGHVQPSGDLFDHF